jgi:hypothetical protein
MLTAYSSRQSLQAIVAHHRRPSPVVAVDPPLTGPAASSNVPDRSRFLRIGLRVVYCWRGRYYFSVGIPL